MLDATGGTAFVFSTTGVLPDLGSDLMSDLESVLMSDLESVL